MLSNYYIQTFLNTRTKMQRNQMIDLHRYNKLLNQSAKEDAQKQAMIASAPTEETKQAAAAEESKVNEEAKAAADGVIDPFAKFRSCGIDEIKMKIMGEPEQYKD